MVGRKTIIPLGPSRLTQTLAKLNAEPELKFQDVTFLRFRLSPLNNHGPRHFANETLPRIRWFNPNLRIDFSKAYDPETKKPLEGVGSEIEIGLKTGQAKTIDIQGKSHESIIHEVMNLVGGPNWANWKKKGKSPVLGPLWNRSEPVEAKVKTQIRLEGPTPSSPPPPSPSNLASAKTPLSSSKAGASARNPFMLKSTDSSRTQSSTVA